MIPIPEALKQAIEKHHSASKDFLNGNVSPLKKMCSHRDDVTIIGGWGGYERGWTEQVEKRYEWAAARFQGGDVQFENISLVAAPELAYSIDIERYKVRKVVHRHADPLLAVQESSSVLQKE